MPSVTGIDEYTESTPACLEVPRLRWIDADQQMESDCTAPSQPASVFHACFPLILQAAGSLAYQMF